MGRIAAELKPISQATSTSAVCNPMDASNENQTDRYRRIPSNVVYQETMESRQLATKSPWTMGRLTAVESEDANVIAQNSLSEFTRDVSLWFQLIPMSPHSDLRAETGSPRTARRAGR